MIPDIVALEPGASEAPAAVVQWASHLPPWINVRPTPVSAERLERLDPGERAAILLAEAQTPPVLLLIDDAEGRAEAERRSLPSTGTLGVLRAGAIRKLTNLPSALGMLRATNFRCAATLIDELLAEDAQRGGGR